MRHSKPILIWTLIIVALCAACGREGRFDQGDIQCPAVTTNQELAQPVPGWTGQRAGTYEDITPPGGWWNKLKRKINGVHPEHPARQVLFIPGAVGSSNGSFQKKDWITSGKRNVRWTFDRNQPAPWMVCIYDGTHVAMERPLPKNPSQCTVHYENSENTPEKIECE